MDNYLNVGNAEIGAAVGVFFGNKARRRVRLPSINKALYYTVVVEMSAQLNRMIFRVFDPFGTEFAIVQLHGTPIEKLPGTFTIPFRKPDARRVGRTTKTRTKRTSPRTTRSKTR